MTRAGTAARIASTALFVMAVVLISVAAYYLPTTVVIIIAAFFGFVAYKFTGYAREDKSL